MTQMVNKNMIIRHLDWDSKFFGLKIGQADTLVATPDIYKDLMIAKQQSGYELIYWFAAGYEEPEPGWINGVLPEPVDVKLVYSNAELFMEDIAQYNINIYKGPLTDKLKELAIESGHKSRFRKDPRLSGRFNEMYATWISRSVDGELADVVLATEIQGDLSGFVTVKKNGDTSAIGLIAVDSRFRGRGLGGGLLKAAGNWCLGQGCCELKVATQMENQIACNLYLKNGYRLQDTRYIFHL